MNIAIVSDEISRDFRTVTEILDTINLRIIELRNLRTGRIPYIQASESIELEKYIRNKNIFVQAISPGVGKLPIDAENLEQESRSLFLSALEFAKRFEIKRIIIFTFRKKNKYDFNETIPEKIIDLLTEFYDLAEKEGIELLVENHSSCYMSTMESIISIANHPKLKGKIRINWDPNNAYLVDKKTYSGGVEEIIDIIESIHVKDTVYDGEFKRTPILEGGVGWDTIFRDLSRFGYDKVLTSETHYEPRISNSINDITILRECVKTYFREN